MAEDRSTVPEPVQIALQAVGQALAVSASELSAAEDERQQAEDAARDVGLRTALVERVITATDAEHRSFWSATLPRLIDALGRPGTAADLDARILDLAEATGTRDALQFPDDAALSRCIEEEDATIVFDALALEAAPSGTVPEDGDLALLGKPVAPPVAAARLDHVLRLTRDPDLLCIAPTAGLHVSFRRLAGTYSHHAVLVGDGTVVHFSGEPLRAKEATVRREPLARPQGKLEPGAVRVHWLERTGHPPVPTFLPNIVVLRALSRVGHRDYGLFGRNCEHFGTWAQCGAMLSGQVDALWRAKQLADATAVLGALGLGIKASTLVMSAYLDAWTMQIGSKPVDIDLASAAVPMLAEGLLDVGRVRWCVDQQKLLWWLPLWTSGDPDRLAEVPMGPRDRPWTDAPATADGVWHTTAPSIALASGWHAALLASPEGVVYAVDRHGRWYRTALDLHEIVERRSAAVVDVNQALARRKDIFRKTERAAEEEVRLLTSGRGS